MAGFTDYLEDRILNHIFRNIASTATANVYVALYTAAPTDAGGGTEVTGGGYARQVCAFAAAASGVISNSGAVSFTASGANYGTVVAGAILDALTSGNMLSWATFSTSAIVNDGDTLSFPIGDISISLE